MFDVNERVVRPVSLGTGSGLPSGQLPINTRRAAGALTFSVPRNIFNTHRTTLHHLTAEKAYSHFTSLKGLSSSD